MKLDIQIQECIKKRISVRSYEQKRVSQEDKDKISKFAEELKNPFGPKVKFHFVEKGLSSKGEKLGTYGFIKGASYFVGSSVENTDLSLEALGYEFENLILYITSLGLSTVWIGLTMNKNGFEKAMKVDKNDLFAAISPIGYATEKRSMQDSLARKVMNADNRKEWRTLFFKDDFSTPLRKIESEDYQIPLEMVRLAPSAKNVQPWRIVKKGKFYHFYVVYAGNNINDGSNTLKRIDMGICMSHFHQTALDLNLKGEFVQKEPNINLPQNTRYVMSWMCSDDENV